MTLADRILQFMEFNSTLYAGMNRTYLRKAIEDCVRVNQFVYKPEKYVFLYWLVTDNDIDGILEKVMPENITGGNILYVAECCCIDTESMKEGINILRRLPFEGAFWHRNNQPVLFPRQKGVMI